MKYSRLLVLVLIAMLAACGGNSNSINLPDDVGNTGDIGDTGGDADEDEFNTAPATATVSPETDLGISEPIVVTFSESMDTASLELGGTLATLAADAAWSKTRTDNDTLTIAPRLGAWNSGRQTVSVTVEDEAGNITETDAVSFEIRVAFETFQAANVVIGQERMDAVYGGPDANRMSTVWGNPAYDPASDTLFLSDTVNHRVLAFEGIPEVNNANADYVIGQADMTSNSPRLDDAGFKYPQTVAVHDGKLFVADYENNRIAIYDPIPVDSGTISVVVGQADKITGTDDLSCSLSGLSSPETVALTPDGKLLVADAKNNRLLIWNEVPTEDGAAADLVLGEADCAIVAGDPPTAASMNYPSGIWTDGVRLVVMDTGNNRILIWNTFPTETSQAADIVLGQADFESGGLGIASASSFNAPSSGVYSNDLQLFVTDSQNHRVLVWNSFPTENNQPADIVIGQSDFEHNAPNDLDQDLADEGQSAKTLDGPVGVTLIRDKLIVADQRNYRYLVFDGQ